MSERNFARAFRRELGLTPAAYVEIARVEAARIALESTRHPGRGRRRGRRLRHGRDDAPRVPSPPGRRPRRVPRSLHVNPSRLEGGTMEIAIPLYDRFTALDAIGPYEVLSRIPDARPEVRRHRGRPLQDRQRHAHDPRRGLARRPPAARDPLRAGRLGHARGDVRRAPRGLDPRCARDQRVDDVGLHRLAAARRRRACSRASTPRATGSSSRRWRELGATPTEPARGRAGQGDHGRRRVVGHRHGALPAGEDLRRRLRARRSSS